MKKKVGLSAVLMMVLLTFMCVGMLGCDEEETAKKTGTVSSEKTDSKEDSDSKDDSDSDEEEKEEKEEKKEKEEKEVKTDKFHPGDIVTVGDFEISYLSAEKYESDNMFLQPGEGKKYIKFTFEFKNVGDSDEYVGSFECYFDDSKCEQAYVTGDDENNLLLESISKGRKVKGAVVFEVPQEAKLKNLEVEYENNSLFSDTKTIFVGK